MPAPESGRSNSQNPHNMPPPPPSAGSRAGTASGQSAGLKDFKQLGALGEGAYSAVYKVLRHSDGKVYALKKVKLPNLSTKEKQNALNEVRLLASVRHKNVIGFYEAFFDERSSSLCIVTEYADGGDLFQKITRHQKMRTHFREDEVWRVLIGMTAGLCALHDLRILHRDLKCANVFLNTNGEVKLGDFNVSKVAKRGLCMTQTGTPYYASPEVWRDMPYDAKSDMWSLGCVVYEMVALRPPFRAEDMEALYRKVLHGQYPRIPPVYSRDISEVIGSLLQVNPRQRPSADQLLQMPVMRRHMDQLQSMRAIGPHGSAIAAHGGENDLLNTIKLPKNALELQDCLPQPRYETDPIDENEPYRDPRAASSGDRAGGLVDSVPHQHGGGSLEPHHHEGGGRRAARERRGSGGDRRGSGRDSGGPPPESVQNEPRGGGHHYQDAAAAYGAPPMQQPPQKDALDAYIIAQQIEPGAGGERGAQQGADDGNDRASKEGSVAGTANYGPAGVYGSAGGYGGPGSGGADYSQRAPQHPVRYDPRQQPYVGPGQHRGSQPPSNAGPNYYGGPGQGSGPAGRGYADPGPGRRMKPPGGRPSYGPAPQYGLSDGQGHGVGYSYHGVGPPPIHATGAGVYHGRTSPSQPGGPPPSGHYSHAPGGPPGMMPPSSGTGGGGRPRQPGQLPDLAPGRAGQYAGPTGSQRIGGHLPMMNDGRQGQRAYGGHHGSSGHHALNAPSNQYQQYQPPGVHHGGPSGYAQHRSSGGNQPQAAVRLPQVHMGGPVNYRRMH